MCFIYVFILYVLTYEITQLQQKINKHMELIDLLSNAQNSDYIQTKVDELVDCRWFGVSYYTEMEFRGNFKHKYKKCEDQVIEYHYHKNDKLFNKRIYDTCAKV